MNTDLETYYEEMGISKKVFHFCQSIEDSLKERFKEIDRITECNQLKVLKAMQEHHLSEGDSSW